MKPSLHTLLFIINLACIIVCSAQNHGTVYKQPKLKGKVKSLTETVYMHKANNPEEGSMRWVWCLKRQYDTLGNNTFTTGYSKTGSELYTDTILYKALGKPTVHYYHNKSYRSQTLHEYNDNGQLITDIDYATTGRVSRRVFYNYNVNGNCISWTQADSAGVIYLITTFVYDTTHNIIQEIDSSLVSKETSITLNYFNNAGQLIEQQTNSRYKHTPTQSNKLYTYDKYENRLSVVNTWIDATTGTLKTIKTTYKYRYDKTGNWVERKAYNDGKLVARDIHEIEYY